MNEQEQQPAAPPIAPEVRVLKRLGHADAAARNLAGQLPPELAAELARLADVENISAAHVLLDEHYDREAKKRGESSVLPAETESADS